MLREFFMSYCTEYLDGNNKFGCAIVHTHPLQVIQNYNSYLSTGVKSHVLISWQELSVEETKYATFTNY